MLTAERARELFSYDPETGEVRWRVRVSNNTRAGSIAGTVSNGGRYRNLRVQDKPYLAHRVIWLMMTGKWPTKQIDHIDGNGLNNIWRNLRGATSAQNCANRKREKLHPTGFKGVLPRYGRFRSHFRGKHLGSFATPEEAHAAYAAAAVAFYGDYSRLE
jgi:hypothetical protein